MAPAPLASRSEFRVTFNELVVVTSALVLNRMLLSARRIRLLAAAPVPTRLAATLISELLPVAVMVALASVVTASLTVIEPEALTSTSPAEPAAEDTPVTPASTPPIVKVPASLINTPPDAPPCPDCASMLVTAVSMAPAPVAPILVCASNTALEPDTVPALWVMLVPLAVMFTRPPLATFAPRATALPTRSIWPALLLPICALLLNNPVSTPFKVPSTSAVILIGPVVAAPTVPARVTCASAVNVICPEPLSIVPVALLVRLALVPLASRVTVPVPFAATAC